MILARHLAIPFLPLLIAAGVLLVCVGLLSQARIWLLLALFLVLGGLRFAGSDIQETPLAALLKGKTSIRQELSFKVLQVLSSGNNSYAIRMERLAGQPLEDVLIFSPAKPMIPSCRFTQAVTAPWLTSLGR